MSEERSLSDIVWTPERGLAEPEIRGIAWDNFLLSDEYSGKWRTSADIRVTPETALQSTVVLASCRILAESIASLPLHVYRRTDTGGREKATDIPLYKVLSFAPNGWQTKFEFFEQVVMNLCLWGNSYTQIKSGKFGAVSELINLHPSRMEVERLENGRLRYSYTSPDTGRIERYTQDQIMHVRWTPEPDGIKGMVPVEIAREAIALARACETHAARYWANSARPGVVLQTDGSLSAEAAERLRENWERLHKGTQNAWRTAVLTNGLKAEPLGFSAEQSQAIESRRFSVEEISRVYRLPLHLIQGTTGGDLETQGQEFITYTLAPWLRRIESAISRSLIYNDDVFFAEFDVRGLLRSDSSRRAAYYSTMTNLGILSINECRALENLPPLEHGDNHFVAMNMQTLEEASKPKQDPMAAMMAAGGAPPPAQGGVPSLPEVKTGSPPTPGEQGTASEKKPAAIKEGDVVTWGDGKIGEVQHVMDQGTLDLKSGEKIEVSPGEPVALVIDADSGEEVGVKVSQLMVAEPHEAKEESRAFCPTGEGGGVNNSCGSGFSSAPAASELSRVSSLGGSTGAILSEDDAGNRYVVKGGNSPDHIKSEAAANSIYRAAGVPIPKSRLDDSDPESPKQVSEYVKAKPLAAVSGPARARAIAEIQKGFAVDALLANWDVVGLEEDNILVPDSGPPLRVDNGGSLKFRAQGKDKPFGPVVGELDSLRQSEQGEPIFGSLTDEQIAAQIDDVVGRRDKILSATPPAIRDVMSQRIDYMEQWASKKKRESRGFCPTGDGGGIDNSCSSVDKSVPDSKTEKQAPAAAPEQPADTADSPKNDWFGTADDAAAARTTIQTKAGSIEVIERSDINTRMYLERIERRGQEMGLVVDFDEAKALQADTDVDEDSGPFQVYVNSGYGLFTGFQVQDYNEVDSYGYDYGVIDDDMAFELVNQRVDDAWNELDKDDEFGEGVWDTLDDTERAEKKDEWEYGVRSEIADQVEEEREESRKRAAEQMKRDLERGLISASLDCCLQLYRGLRLGEHDIQRIMSDGYITHPGPNSWTTSRDVAASFNAYQVLLVLRSPKVGHVNTYNSHSENEVIRPPSKMRISGVVKTNSGVVFYVDEDEDYKD